MKAAMLYGFGDLRLDDLPDPECGPREVVIDVRCVQLSVTECMLIAGDGVALHDSLATRLQEGPVQFGGHEFAGVVSAVGNEVSQTWVGQRVTAVETLPCERCTSCIRGHADGCTGPAFVGFTRPGALAERVKVPESALVPLVDEVSFSAGAAVQPLAGAVHAHAALGVQPGETMLVLGGGVMGLLAVAVARHGNAGNIILATRDPRKLEIGRTVGADLLVDASEDVDSFVLDATGGVGADVVVETAGGSHAAGLAGTSTVEVAVRAVRRGGRIAVVSVLPARAELPTGLMREKGLALIHPSSGGGHYSRTSSTFEHSLNLIARGSVDVERLVTHCLQGLSMLADAVEITRNKAHYNAINPAQIELP